MRFGFNKFVAAGVAAVAMVAGVARAEAPDASTPKKAAVAFTKAVVAGDMATVKSLSTGTDAEYALVKTLSEMLAATKRLETAAARKFGDAGKLPAEASVDVVADMEAATEKLDGETARMITKNKTEDMNPMTLKKDGSSWKVDLSTLSKDPEAAAVAMMAPSMVKAMDAVTKNIEAGKYKDITEAMTDVATQMAAGAGLGALDGK
ncbi:MAG: hypothetical protein ACAI43_18765 [Phycisphaerae bacterium]|nr:hypothetical protein [Tepidisphaeraceae bacterium]